MTDVCEMTQWIFRRSSAALNTRPPQIGDSSICCHLQATENMVLPAQREQRPAVLSALAHKHTIIGAPSLIWFACCI